MRSTRSRTRCCYSCRVVPTEAELLDKIAKLEQELERQREQAEAASTMLEVVTQQMPGTYWLLDHELRIVRNGGAIELILGFPMQRFVGKTMYDDMRRMEAIVRVHRQLRHERDVPFPSRIRK